MKQFILKNAMAVAAMAIAAGSYALMSFGSGTDKTAVETPLYWHEVVPGSVETLGPLLNSTPQTKTEAMSGQTQITNCDDSSTEACLRGFDTPQNEGDPAGPDLAPEFQINKS